jgi:two-component system phosphate regulon sensor histidine kinase PhoR
MSSRTLRIFTVLSVLLLLGMGLMQWAWLRQAYRLEDRDFDQRVRSALRAAGQRLIQFNANPNRLTLQPVERVAGNYYTVQINDVINPTVLEAFLRQEFDRHDVRTNFEYGVYDCVKNRVQYGGFVCATRNCDSSTALRYRFPQTGGQNYYFGVYFPEKRGYVLGQLGSLTLSTAVLSVVVLFFACALWVIFRQKRLAELQADFVNTLSHEFKTPISTLLIAGEVLAKPDQSPERRQTYAALLRSEIHRLKTHVDTVLQTARLPRSSEGLKRELVNIHVLLRQLGDSLQSEFEAQNGTLTLRLDAEKPVVSADRLHLTNVFRNLADNALKYTNRPPELLFSTENHRNALLVRITDNGIGIAEKHRKRLFDKFYRVPTGDVHDVKGFGLGLYYVKTLVEAHGGRVRIQSRVGEGSTFEIQLRIKN